MTVQSLADKMSLYLLAWLPFFRYRTHQKVTTSVAYKTLDAVRVTQQRKARNGQQSVLA
jgi:hypothetical protein